MLINEKAKWWINCSLKELNSNWLKIVQRWNFSQKLSRFNIFVNYELLFWFSGMLAGNWLVVFLCYAAGQRLTKSVLTPICTFICMTVLHSSTSTKANIQIHLIFIFSNFTQVNWQIKYLFSDNYQHLKLELADYL